MCLQVLADVTVRHPLADQTDGKHGRDTDERDNVGMPEKLPHDSLTVERLGEQSGRGRFGHRENGTNPSYVFTSLASDAYRF
jgi:hypothetical protein